MLTNESNKMKAEMAILLSNLGVVVIGDVYRYNFVEVMRSRLNWRKYAWREI
jgi:hypothetical protein